MTNYLSVLLATLSHIGVITKEEAEKLYEELKNETLPDSFESSWQMVKRVFEKLEIETKTFSKK